MHDAGRGGLPGGRAVDRVPRRRPARSSCSPSCAPRTRRWRASTSTPPSATSPSTSGCCHRSRTRRSRSSRTSGRRATACPGSPCSAAQGHPLPVDPHLVVPPRAAAQLVGQLGLRRPVRRQLVRGAHRLPRRPPVRRAARRGRGLPAGHAEEVQRLRARRPRTSRSRSSAPGPRPPRRRSGYGKSLMLSPHAAPGGGRRGVPGGAAGASAAGSAFQRAILRRPGGGVSGRDRDRLGAVLQGLDGACGAPRWRLPKPMPGGRPTARGTRSS